jgi:hypothetical protein
MTQASWRRLKLPQPVRDHSSASSWVIPFEVLVPSLQGFILGLEGAEKAEPTLDAANHQCVGVIIRRLVANLRRRLGDRHGHCSR